MEEELQNDTENMTPALSKTLWTEEESEKTNKVGGGGRGAGEGGEEED